jgi:hypothetical protein
MVEHISMSDDFFHDAEEISQIYKQSHSTQIKELNDIIVMLRTKITYLEKRLKESIDSAQDKVPAHIKWQIEQLKQNNKDLKNELKERDKVEVPRYYEREFKNLMKQNELLKEDLEFYKKKVPVQVVINRENKDKPTRKGGIPK